MGPTIWLAASTLHYPQGGGHLWVYLNWALGLKELGCTVVWLESVEPEDSPETVRNLAARLRLLLEEYGLRDGLALCSRKGAPLPKAATDGCRDLTEAREADLLLNLSYDKCTSVLELFRRTALMDIDPGLLQVWLSEGVLPLGRHDVYFTTGETVGRPGARFPSAGIEWHYAPPCVATEHWPVSPAPPNAPFTTVSHWFAREWLKHGEESYENSKRTGFLPFLELPRRTDQLLELALCLDTCEDEERRGLELKGWRVRHAHDVASTPQDYQRYIRASRGEFSCAKPSCVRLQNAWISDRTLCYLASGRPAVVQHTGRSSFLPEDAGLLRFRDLPEAARHLETVAADYDRQCRLARALVDEHFDARTIARRVLERALDGNAPLRAVQPRDEEHDGPP